jgi:hypothetical protein
MRVVNFAGQALLARSIDEGSGAVKLWFLRVKFGRSRALRFVLCTLFFPEQVKERKSKRKAQKVSCNADPINIVSD